MTESHNPLNSITSRYRRILPWACVIGWIAVIFFLSAQPQLPAINDAWGDFQDVAGHLAAYGVLAGVLRWALAGTGVRRPGLWALVVAVLYGISDEFHQSFVPHRHPDVLDVLTDAVGALVVLWLLRLIEGRIQRR